MHCNIASDYQENYQEYCMHLFWIWAIIWDITQDWYIFKNIYTVWFTDENLKPIEIEDKINITLVINWCTT